MHTMFYRILQKVVIVNFASILIVSTLAIVFRYVFNSSLYWSDELIRYAFVWLIFSSSALLLKEDKHVKVELLLENAAPRFKRFLTGIDEFISGILTLFFVIGGFFWMWNVKGMESPALGLPMHWILYGALPISFLPAAWFMIQKLKQ